MPVLELWGHVSLGYLGSFWGMAVTQTTSTTTASTTISKKCK